MAAIGSLTNNFTFADFSGDNIMTVTSNTGVRKVTLGQGAKDKLVFGDQLEMVIESEGISFNYIGEIGE